MGWTFSKLEVYRAQDFYPLPFEPKPELSDNWEPIAKNNRCQQDTKPSDPEMVNPD